jgi:hypothetical protein
MLGLDQWGTSCWLLLGTLHYRNQLASLLTKYMRQSRKQKRPAGGHSDSLLALWTVVA